MALVQAYSTASGIDLPESYHRLEQVNLNYNNSSAHLQVAVYKDATARASGKQPVVTQTHDLLPKAHVRQDTGDSIPAFGELFDVTKLDTNNPVKTAYTFLKGLSKYQSALDA